MSIESEIKSFVADIPAPMSEQDIEMIRGLIARVASLEMIVKTQDKAIGVLQAAQAKP